MNSESLRELQAPFKERYKHSPEAALITLRAQGNIDDSGVACTVESGDALRQASIPQRAGAGCRLVLVICCYKPCALVPA